MPTTNNPDKSHDYYHQYQRQEGFHFKNHLEEIILSPNSIAVSETKFYLFDKRFSYFNFDFLIFSRVWNSLCPYSENLQPERFDVLIPYYV